jgi:hypothetical protein
MAGLNLLPTLAQACRGGVQRLVRGGSVSSCIDSKCEYELGRHGRTEPAAQA